MRNIKLFKDFLSVNENAISADINKNFEEIKKAVSKANQYLNVSNPEKYDELFMIEIAMAETKLGTDTNSMRTTGSGGRGAWQLDKIGFEAGRDVNSHPNVKKYVDRLKSKGINWLTIEWDKCNELLYGAIAARLFLLNKPFTIGKTIEERANQWKEHYNSSSGAGSAKEYIERVDYCKDKLGVHDVLPGISVPRNDNDVTSSRGGLVNFLNTQGKKTVINKDAINKNETNPSKSGLAGFLSNQGIKK